MTQNQGPIALDYATARSKRPSRQRIFYCIGLPILAFGLGMGVAGSHDQLPTAVCMAIGALLVGFALPVQDRP